MEELTLTDQNFSEEVLNSKGLILVDFWAEWCEPCLMMNPVLEEMAEELKGDVKIGKLNVDENSITPSTYEIEAIPALILFKNGQIFKRFIGVQLKEVLINVIKLGLNEG